jgi:cell division protein FtsW (lipid II flippase)
MIGRLFDYFYAWIPAGFLGVVLIFLIPFLGPIAVLVVAVALLAALGRIAWKLVAAVFAVARFVVRRSREPEVAAARSAQAQPATVQRRA